MTVLPQAVLDAETWPEGPSVNIRISTQLLREWAESLGPVKMTGLHGPDSEGFYEPQITFDQSKCPRCSPSHDVGDYTA